MACRSWYGQRSGLTQAHGPVQEVQALMAEWGISDEAVGRAFMKSCARALRQQNAGALRQKRQARAHLSFCSDVGPMVTP